MAARLNTIIERLQAPASPRALALTVKHAAAMLDVSPSTIKRMVRDGRVRSERVRGRRLIALDSLQSLIQPR